MSPHDLTTICRECRRPVIQTGGSRNHQFCSATCASIHRTRRLEGNESADRQARRFAEVRAIRAARRDIPQLEEDV